MTLGPISRLAAPLLVLALMPASLAAGPWVVVGSQDGQWDVFLTDDDGAVIEQVTQSEGMERSAVCDGSGNIVYTEDDGTLVLVSRASSESSTVLGGRDLDRLLMISPSRVVASETQIHCEGREGSRLVVIDLHTQNIWSVVGRSQAAGTPAYDPESGSLFYTLRILGPGQLVLDQVWRHDHDGTEAFLWNSDGIIGGLQWSPELDVLAVAYRHPPGEPVLHFLFPDGKSAEPKALPFSDRLQLAETLPSDESVFQKTFEDIRSLRPCLN